MNGRRVHAVVMPLSRWYYTMNKESEAISHRVSHLSDNELLEIVTAHISEHSQVMIDSATKELTRRKIPFSLLSDSALESTTSNKIPTRLYYGYEAEDWRLSIIVIVWTLVLMSCYVFRDLFFPLAITGDEKVDLVVNWMIITVITGMCGLEINRLMKIKKEREKTRGSKQN